MMDAPAPSLTPSPLPEDALIVVATREAVLFPGAVIPLAATRPATTEALQTAARESRHVVVVLQRTRPTEAGVNWLPTPAGAFRLNLRIYRPKASVLSGAWQPPPVQRVP